MQAPLQWSGSSAPFSTGSPDAPPDQLAALETADVATYYAADIKFHRLITEAAGNAYLKSLYESVTTHVFPTPFDIMTLLPSIYLVHQEIVSGLSDRDPERVDRAVTRHADSSMARLTEQMASEAERKAAVARIREGSPLKGPKLRRRKP